MQRLEPKTLNCSLHETVQNKIQGNFSYNLIFSFLLLGLEPLTFSTTTSDTLIYDKLLIPVKEADQTVPPWWKYFPDYINRVWSHTGKFLVKMIFGYSTNDCHGNIFELSSKSNLQYFKISYLTTFQKPNHYFLFKL